MHSKKEKTIADVLESTRFYKKLNSYNMDYVPMNKCICKDHSIISFYAKCENNTIFEISYECNNCDILLRVVLEIFCEKIQGRKLKNALDIGSKEIIGNQIFKFLDASKQKMVKHYFSYVKDEFNKMVENSSKSKKTIANP